MMFFFLNFSFFLRCHDSTTPTPYNRARWWASSRDPFSFSSWPAFSSPPLFLNRYRQLLLKRWCRRTTVVLLLTMSKNWRLRFSTPLRQKNVLKRRERETNCLYTIREHYFLPEKHLILLWKLVNPSSLLLAEAKWSKVRAIFKEESISLFSDCVSRHPSCYWIKYWSPLIPLSI